MHSNELKTIVKRIMTVQVDIDGLEIEEMRDFDHWVNREVSFDLESGERA